jgi:hypothetical protein
MPERTETAMTQLVGSYNLRIYLPDLERNLIIDPNSLRNFVVSQSLTSFLPSLRMIIPSAGEEYIHVVPLDKTNRISIDIGFDTDIYEGGNSFDFLTYRRFPRSHETLLDIEALLDVRNLFDKRHIRGFSGTIHDTIENISKELKLFSATIADGQRSVKPIISDSLRYEKNIIQTNQTNAELLSYLRRNVEGKNGEGAYYCFLYNRGGNTYFAFRSMEDMMQEPIKHYLCYGTSAMPKTEEDKSVVVYNPVWSYEIVDDVKLEGVEGLGGSIYHYFDYKNGEIKENTIDLQDMYSLTYLFSVMRGSNKVTSRSLLGRSNDFNNTFSGVAKSSYYKKLMNLEKIRVNTYAMLNAAPGDLVRFVFAQPIAPEDQMDFQYQGTWMIESLHHSIGMMITTTLTLIRSGVDANPRNSSLIPATRRKHE